MERKRSESSLPLIAISVMTVLSLLLNAYGLTLSITTILPHLLYIPVILAAYYYPKRGILFTIFLCLLYCGIIAILLPGDHSALVGGIERSVILLFIAIIVSFLTQRALDEAEKSARLARIVESSDDAILSKTLDGIITSWNAGAGRIYGYSAQEIVGRHISVLTPDDHSDEVDNLLKKIGNGELVRHYQTLRKRKSGEIFSVSITISPIRNARGEITGASTIARDISEQKKAEDAVKESETKFRTLADYTNDWEYWTGPDRAIIYMTPSVERMTGYSPADFLNDPNLILSITHPDDMMLVKNHLEQSMERRECGPMDFRILHKDGSLRWINHICRPVISPEGQFLGRRGSNRDITDRKLAEMSLAVANRKLGMLSSITRHDILNQLMALKGFLELSKQKEMDPQLKDYLEREMGIADVIQRQIEFSRYYEHVGVKTPEWQDAFGTFLAAASQLTLGGIQVSCTGPDTEIYADPLIEKVFFNLIENSLRHGGHVSAVSLSAEEREGEMLLTYRDNGDGIAPEVRENLFRKGFGKHTGLGLFLSREILAITGISIRENGEPGKGVRFEIVVPKGVYRFSGPRG